MLSGCRSCGAGWGSDSVDVAGKLARAADIGRPRRYRAVMGPEALNLAGLCGGCAHARLIETRIGSRFILCELSRTDRRFPRYPALPVLACAGFQPAAPAAPPASLDAPERPA